MKEKVQRCLVKIEANEKEIIQNDINERTIAHKLAEYLQIEFIDYNVDVEYNRNYENGEYEPKKAYLIKDGFREAFLKAKETEENLIKFMDQVTTYPDIIIHKRMSNEKNLLVIEIKKSNNNGDWEIDRKKLEAFTRRKNDEGYGYTLGLHLVFHISKHWRKPEIYWYENGILGTRHLIIE